MTRRNSVALGFLVFFLLAGAALQTPLLRFARDWVWTGWNTTVARLMGIHVSQPNQQRLEELLAENIRLKAELKDYAQLRKDIGSPSFDNFRTIPAAVIGRPIDTFQSELLLSRGARDGVILGAPLVVQGSILVGFISELNEHSSVARLLVHPSTTLAANVIDPTFSVDQVSTSGLVRGKSYTSLFLTTIPRDESLHEGSQVITAAEAGHLPPGLFIGTVKTIRDQKNAAYKEALLDLPYDSDDFRAVTVLVLP